VKKALKIALIVVGGLLAIVLVIGGVSQTQFFRDRLRSVVVSSLDSLLDAEVSLGPLSGNLVTGFSMDGMVLRHRGDALLEADRLELRYDLFQIPGKDITINSFTLVHPRIRLIRGIDGVWNFRRMVRPTPNDTSVRGPFDWNIALKHFEIQHGEVSLVDSVALAEPGHRDPDTTTVEYHDIALHDVNLVLSGFMGHTDTHASITMLSFTSARPGLTLRRLSGEFSVTPAESRVQNLLISTGRSTLRLNASLKDINLLGGIRLDSLRQCPAAVTLDANPIDLTELQRFIPSLRFLNGQATVAVATSGEFGQLKVDRLDVGAGKTQMYLKGGVYNLHDPSNLYLAVKVTESKVTSADLRALMPGLTLPDLQSLGTCTLNLEYDGTPLDFHSRSLLETAAGNIRSDVAMKIGGPSTLRYKGDILLQNVDLARIAEDVRLQSRLNGTVVIEGEGLSMAVLRGHANVQCDSSEFRGLPVGRTTLTLDAAGRMLTGAVHASIGKTTGDFTASLDDRNTNDPTFTVDGKVASLNLEDVLHDPTANSDITLRVTANGRGLTWSTLGGDFLVDFSSSRYGDYLLSQGEVHCRVDQRDPERKSVSLESNVADLSVTGAFELPVLAKVLTYEVQALRLAIGQKLAGIDSSLAGDVDQTALRELGSTLAKDAAPLDAECTLHIKDLEPVSVAAGDRTFNGTGVVRGTIRGDIRNLSLEVTAGIEDFFYGTAEAGVLIQDAALDAKVDDLRMTNPLQSLATQLTVNVGKLHVNRTELDSVVLELSYAGEQSHYEAAAFVNRDVRCGVRGFAQVSEDRVAFTFDRLQWAYQDYAWDADPGATVTVTGKGVSIAGVTMRRDSQEVAVQGSLGVNGTLTALVDARSLDLRALRYVAKNENNGPPQQLFSGMAHVKVAANGSLQRPEISATVATDGITFRTVPFGRFAGSFAYKDEALRVDASLDEAQGADPAGPELMIAGTIPVNLSFAAVDERLPDLPMDLSIRSRGIQIGILDPLLPTFNQLSGRLTCDVHIGGSTRHPQYKGDIDLADCAFLFVPNNIAYRFEGRFQPDGERIRVVSATVRNVPADEHGGRKGSLTLGGDFSLRDLRPGDFALWATGQLLVVKETTRRSSLEVYGNLFVEIGEGGLHFTGSIENSLLKGNLLISNSTLIFPPPQATVAEESALSVPVIFVDDTTRATGHASRPLLARYFGIDSATVKHDEQGLLPTKSFLDGVRYDLAIETVGGSTEIRMIFNPATSEELLASISGKFSITEDGKRWFGDLTVDRAYYNFFKRFNATGTIRYTGDFLNPGLDIKAQYQGTRVIRDSVSEHNEKVVVTFTITGTRLEPKISYGMTLGNDDEDYYAYSGPGAKSNDIQSDAIQFIMAGSFPLTSAQKNDVASDLRTTLGSSLLTGAASLLTGTLSEFLRNETGFINSVELQYGARGGFSESEIRLSGQAWNGYWRYNGKILDDPLANANFSLLYSFGTIFNDLTLRNLMFELERRVETSTYGQASDLKRVNSARLFYRFSF
jgi:hypothetical protein